MLDVPALFLIPITLLLGGAVLWIVYVIQRQYVAVHDPLNRILPAACFVLILTGLLGLVVGFSGFVSLILAPAVPVILLMALNRHRASERRALLLALATAAERNIPLGPVARAFAEERLGFVGHRAWQLAELLDAGMPLPAALPMSGHRLTTDEQLAVELGCETGALGPTLRHAATGGDELDETMQSILAKYFYVCALILVVLLILTFVMIKIVPVFAVMFDEFGLALPPVTRLVIDSSRGFSQSWFLFAPLMLLGLFVLGIGTLHYIGWLPAEIPIVQRFWRRADAAVLMRSLAITVRQQRPLDETIAMLSQTYPNSGIRSRLRRALAMIGQGSDWCESLRRVGLIRAADAALLGAAQRVGNLPWALEEMADSSLRRLSYRLRAALNLLFPFVLLAFGFFVMMIVVGLFLPLVELIRSLA